MQMLMLTLYRRSADSFI